jgi:hypothetical protein
VALRFATRACLVKLIAALAVRSVWLLVVLACVCAAGGVASLHPFDLVWEHGIRHLLRAPALPPNPPRGRRPWRIAAVVLAADALLMAVGATPDAIALGVLRLLGLLTATSFTSAPRRSWPLGASAAPRAIRLSNHRRRRGGGVGCVVSAGDRDCTA